MKINHRKKHKLAKVFCILSLILTFSSCGVSNVSAQTTETLTVTFIDVGQGDSSLISTDSGFDILIDAGARSAGPTVLTFLTSQGVDSLEVIVISHNHEDHLGGLLTLLQSTISVGEVYYNGNSCATRVCQDVWTEMANRGITPVALNSDHSYVWDSLSTNILNPQITPTGNENEDSVVMDVSFYENNLLFTGDIGFSTESTLLSQNGLGPLDLLKVAHHGSAYSTSTDFLNATSPPEAVISVGADNTYDHPSSDTLTRLSNAGARTSRTDLSGDLRFSFTETQPGGPNAILVFIPLIMNGAGSIPAPTPEPPPEPTPPPDPMPGENLQCNNQGDVEICASVSNATPGQYSYVTVYGRLVINGSAQSGKPMTTTWHYKTTTSTCSDGVTDSGGVAHCQRYISRASVGYQVNIDVSIDGVGVTTWFTPRD